MPVFIENSNPDQSSHILHPELRFPWAQCARACTHTQKSHLGAFVCSCRLCPCLIQHSVTAARPNLGEGDRGRAASLFPCHKSVSLCGYIKERREEANKQQDKRQNETATPYTHTCVCFLPLVMSGLVSFQRGQQNKHSLVNSTIYMYNTNTI